MEEEFELKLKTSRVTLDRSYATGDIYHAGNDEAWLMINDNMAELVGDNAPEKPQRIIEIEQKAEAERQVADVELYPAADHGIEPDKEDGPEVCRDPNIKPGKKGKKKP